MAEWHDTRSELGEKVPVDTSEEQAVPGLGIGTEFERQFLLTMVQDHERSLALAEHEVSAGRYAPAKDLANKVIAEMKAELAQLRGLLNAT